MKGHIIIIILIIFFSSLILSLKSLEKYITFDAEPMIDAYKKYNLFYDHINDSLINKNNGLKLSVTNQLNNSLGIYYSENKDIANKLLKKNKIPIPNQYKYNNNKSLDYNLKEIKNLLNKGYFKFPLVVKPTNGTQSYGVFLDLNSIDKLKEKILFLENLPIIIQQQVYGDSFRILVYNNKIIDVLKREAPYIIGNNIDTINTLVQKYNSNQKKNNKYPVNHICQNLIKNQGYTLNSILPKNKKIIISNVLNYHNGCNLIRIPINSIHKDNIKMFLKTNKILNLNLSGIDYNTNSLQKSYLDEGNESNIIEVNYGPSIITHYNTDKKQKMYAVDRFLSKLLEDLNP